MLKAFPGKSLSIQMPADHYINSLRHAMALRIADEPCWAEDTTCGILLFIFLDASHSTAIFVDISKLMK